MIPAIVCIDPGIKVEPMPFAAKRLGYHVLHQHPLVDIELVQQDVAIQRIVRILVIMEGLGN